MESVLDTVVETVALACELATVLVVALGAGEALTGRAATLSTFLRVRAGARRRMACQAAPPPKPAAQAAIKSQVRISLSIELPRGNIRLQSGEESRLTPFVVQSKKFCVFREDSVFCN